MVFTVAKSPAISDNDRMLTELVDSLIQSVSQWINNLPKSNIKCYNNSRVIEVVDSLIQAISQ